jgi:hypothetical protein
MDDDYYEYINDDNDDMKYIIIGSVFGTFICLVVFLVIYICICQGRCRNNE